LNIVVDIGKGRTLMSAGHARRLAAALAAVVLTTLSACSTSSATDGRLQVVASTDVYADIVRAVAGSRVDITSFLGDPSQDPHSFEASPRNQLAVSRADVIIENGGGYDDFMNRMRAASAKADATTIDVVALSGHRAPPGGELNEHVWYDFATVDKLVTRLVSVLSARRPADAATFRTHAHRFTDRLRTLKRTEAQLRARYGGAPVAVTEPVPDYLLGACGLVNRTPTQFSASVAEGTDVSASVLEQTLNLFSTHAVRVLVYNEQSGGAQPDLVVAAARAAAIAVVPVTETLPAAATYLSWMRANLSALAEALSR
jgi:zinc/manganese transport system substrate-binding protein